MSTASLWPVIPLAFVEDEYPGPSSLGSYSTTVSEYVARSRDRHVYLQFVLDYNKYIFISTLNSLYVSHWYNSYLLQNGLNSYHHRQWPRPLPRPQIHHGMPYPTPPRPCRCLRAHLCPPLTHNLPHVPISRPCSSCLSGRFSNLFR